MRLWTLQPLKIWQILQESGTFYCNPEECTMLEFQKPYKWLAEQMCRRIGPAPGGIKLPVWAWYQQNYENKKPDLRSERWRCGEENQDYVCMELSIDENKVVLSDFDSWVIILNDGLISASEEEYEELKNKYEHLPDNEKFSFKQENWKRVFDIAPYDNEWRVCGKWIQATFWELRREDVKSVKFFRTGIRKSDNIF